MFFKEWVSFVLFLLLPLTKGAIPGTFFWRPRFGLDLAIPNTEPPIAAYQPNKKNIQEGIVVLIEGYDILTSMLALMSAVQFANDDDTMNPGAGLYYTGVYRWALRSLDLFPHWFRGNFHEALGVWRNRFKFMDAQVPPWVKKALPWITKESWDQESIHLAKYRKESESAFSQFYRFPSKTFHNFNSFLPDTVEDFIFSSVERDDYVNEESSKERKEREKKMSGILQKPAEVATSPLPIVSHTNTTEVPQVTPTN